MEHWSVVGSPLAVLTVLMAVTAGFLYVEQRTRWRLFAFFPPLLFIYAVPRVLYNTPAFLDQ
jgi:uncharacterized membrane protein